MEKKKGKKNNRNKTYQKGRNRIARIVDGKKFTHPALPLPIASRKMPNLFVISQRALVWVLQSMSFSLILSWMRTCSSMHVWLYECLVHHFGISFELSSSSSSSYGPISIKHKIVFLWIFRANNFFYISFCFYLFFPHSSLARTFTDTAMEQKQATAWASDCGVYSFAYSQPRSADRSILLYQVDFEFFSSAFYTCTNINTSSPPLFLYFHFSVPFFRRSSSRD